MVEDNHESELVAELRSQLAESRAQHADVSRRLDEMAKAMADHARAFAQFATAAAPATSSSTIRQIFDAYRDHRRRDHSWGVIEDRLLPLVRRLGDLPAIHLTPKKWAEHRRARAKEPLSQDRPEKLPSAATLNLELARAKTMLTWAAEEEQGFIPSNPLRDAKREKPKPPRKTWLPEPDIQRLLSAPKPKMPRARKMLKAFVLIKADTGLRFNEVRKIRRDRIRILGPDEIIADIPETKNGNSHLVGLTLRDYEALEELPQHLTSPHYFVNEDRRGSLFAESTMWRWFRDACESSGVDALVAEGEVRVRPHDMRRSAATNAHNRGASLLDVQDMLNHKSPAVTAQYVQRSQANAVKIAKLMQTKAEEEQEAARVGPQRAPRPTLEASRTKGT